MSSPGLPDCEVCRSTDARYAVLQNERYIPVCDACGKFLFAGFLASRQNVRWLRLDRAKTGNHERWDAPAPLVRAAGSLRDVGAGRPELSSG